MQSLGFPLLNVSDMQELKKHVKHLYKGIRILHALNLFHMDLRASNYLVFGGMARIIDWQTLISGSANVIMFPFHQGQLDAFWPANPEDFNSPSRFAHWDLVHFAHSIFFLASRDDAEKGAFVQGPETRDALISSFAVQPNVDGDLRVISAKILALVNQAVSVDQPVDYEAIAALFL